MKRIAWNFISWFFWTFAIWFALLVFIDLVVHSAHLVFIDKQLSDALAVFYLLLTMFSTALLTALGKLPGTKKLNPPFVISKQVIYIAVILLGLVSLLPLIARHELIANESATLRADPRRNIPLIVATEKGDLNEVSRLLKSGANKNESNEYGETALQAAAARGSADLVKLLIEHGADISLANWNGETPLSNAISGGFKEIVALLITNGANINDKNPYGLTPLHVAVKENQREVVELLIDKGANVNAKNPDGLTPLNVAVEANQKEIVELLIEKGADVNAESDIGWTPLHFAASNLSKSSTDDSGIAVLLIIKGANVNAKDNNGKTPFDLAVLKKDEGISSIFVPTPNVHRPKSGCVNSRKLPRIEREICFFPPLTNLDQKLNEAYSAALKAAKMPKNIRSEQQDWISERNKKCGNEAPDCSTPSLMKLYSLQIDRLNQLVRNPSLNDAKDTCSAIAELAGRNQVKALAIRGADLIRSLTEKNSANEVLTSDETAQLKAIDHWSYQSPSALYQLQLKLKQPPERFVQFSTGGSCASTQIFNLKFILNSQGQSTGWVKVDDPGEILRWAYWGGGDYPIKYQDHYYMVTANLADANSVKMISSIKSDGKILPMCMIEKSSIEYIVSSGMNGLCSSIANGTLKPLVWTDDSSRFHSKSRDELVKSFGGYADSIESLKIDLDGDGKIDDIERFTYNSGAGCGSTNIWGRILSENQLNVVKGNLSDFVSKFAPPFEIYEANKKFYVRTEISKGKEKIVQILGNKVKEVCELQARVHYKPKEVFEAKD